MKTEGFFAAESAATTANTLAERKDMDAAYQWQLTDIFENDAAWESIFSDVEKNIPNIDKFQNKLAESGEKLLACLQLRDQIAKNLSQLYLYAGLKNDQDTREPRYQAFRDKIGSLHVRYDQATAFIQPEILAISEKKLESFIKNTPGLSGYQHYLDNLSRVRPHTLPPEQERLLAMAGEMAQSPYHVFSMFNNADIKFPSIKDEKGVEIEVTKGRYSRLMESKDRRVRKDAFDAMYGSYGKWTNTLAANLAAAVKRDVFYARAKNYNSALAAALDADNIPTSVYDNVVDTCNNNLAPLHRYMTLRQKMLKLDKLKAWDLYVPLVSNVDFDIPYPEALGMMRNAFKPLGSDYLAALESGLTGGWIDVYENQGKRSGAYSWSTYGTHPYILLNYNKTLNHVFTTAHELGHALHSYYTHKHQPYHYSHYTIFVAEVASTLNEALLMHYLLKTNNDKQKKLYLLNEYVDQIRGTVYTQALFAEFEKVIHSKVEAGEALTAEVLNELAGGLYQRYFGPAFTMDAIYKTNWCRIPHFYYNFYVYQYATGFSAATALSQKIIAGDTDAQDAYLRFLSRGNSAYSINLLKDAGVDMSSPAPIEATTKLMDRLLDQMETLIED